MCRTNFYNSVKHGPMKEQIGIGSMHSKCECGGKGILTTVDRMKENS